MDIPENAIPQTILNFDAQAKPKNSSKGISMPCFVARRHMTVYENGTQSSNKKIVRLNAGDILIKTPGGLTSVRGEACSTYQIITPLRIDTARYYLNWIETYFPNKNIAGKELLASIMAKHAISLSNSETAKIQSESPITFTIKGEQKILHSLSIDELLMAREKLVSAWQQNIQEAKDPRFTKPFLKECAIRMALAHEMSDCRQKISAMNKQIDKYTPYCSTGDNVINNAKALFSKNGELISPSTAQRKVKEAIEEIRELNKRHEDLKRADEAPRIKESSPVVREVMAQRGDMIESLLSKSIEGYHPKTSQRLIAIANRLDSVEHEITLKAGAKLLQIRQQKAAEPDLPLDNTLEHEKDNNRPILHVRP